MSKIISTLLITAALVGFSPTISHAQTVTKKPASRTTLATPVSTKKLPAPTLEERIAALEKKVAELTARLILAEKTNTTNNAIITTPQKTREEALTDAVALVSPSVVSIVASKDVPRLETVYVNPFGDDPAFKDSPIRVPTYRDKGTEQVKTGAGTGFVITSTGYIATNRHVVSEVASNYTVLLSTGTQLPAKVVYRDPQSDFALLKIESKEKLPFVELGDSTTLKSGQSVIAIGNALGEFNNSVSVGVISGLSRNIQASTPSGKSESLSDVIQTDAAINPGNSGGPLVNLEGKIIGVNVATVIGSQNIGFAIPIGLVKRILLQLPIDN